MCKEHVSRVRFRTPFIFSPRHQYPSFVSPRAVISSQNRSRIIDRSYIFLSLARSTKKIELFSDEKNTICFEKPRARRCCCFLIVFWISKNNPRRAIFARRYLRKSVGTKSLVASGRETQTRERERRKRPERRIAARDVARFRSCRTTARALSPIL